MPGKIQTLREIRLFMINELKGSYDIREAGAIADLLIKHMFGTGTGYSILTSTLPVNEGHLEQAHDYCTRIRSGLPVQYLTGETTFFNCTIRLNGNELIPRQETEELVDLVIKENKGYKGRICDVGTGSGCIAIALALNLPGTEVTAIDISDELLSGAAANAALNNASISFMKGDVLAGENIIPPGTGIIVSNPPYVRESEKQLMNRNVLDHEPHIALFVPDSDPLLFYRAILRHASGSLSPGGRVYFEINEALGKETEALLLSSGFTDVHTIRDLNNKDRIVKGTRNAR